MGRLEDHWKEAAVVYNRRSSREAGLAQASAAPLPSAAASFQTYLTVTFANIELLFSNMCFCLRFCGLSFNYEILYATLNVTYSLNL